MKEQADAMIVVEMRRCTWCRETKPMAEFLNSRGSLCQSCRQRSTPKNFSFVDMVGERYGKLIVLNHIVKTAKNKRSNGALWLCRCDCGDEKIVERRLLIKGSVASCGKCGYVRLRGNSMNPRFCKNCGNVIPISRGRGCVSKYCSKLCRGEYIETKEYKYFIKLSATCCGV